MKLDKLKDLILYQSENTNKYIEVLYDNEDFWLTQKTMGELFNVAENNITYHLQNIFKSGELKENLTTQKIRVVQKEGKRQISREINFYSLDAMYLDFAERQVKLGHIISMKEWKEKLEMFLNLNEYNILKDNGKVKREIADKLALEEYEKYRILQDQKYISDFDELLLETKNIKLQE